ncbi:MAG: nicotinate (nicotinamide) nucleotide adenylyltransferase, partial [Planctomycetota bacterium]
RAALMRGENVENLLPDGVADYIKRNGLYGWRRQQ